PVPAMVQVPPPGLLRAAPSLPPCAADRLAFVQPMDSKPVVLTLLVDQATPASTPKVLSQELLTRAEPRLPHLSACWFLVPVSVKAVRKPLRSNGRALRMSTIPAAPPSSIAAVGLLMMLTRLNSSPGRKSMST